MADGFAALDFTPQIEARTRPIWGVKSRAAAPSAL